MKYYDFLVNAIGNSIEDPAKLPKGYQLIGHVVLLSIHPDLLPLADVIGELTLEFESRSKSVGVRMGPTRGQKRIPNYKLVAGSKNTTTTHTENGIEFKLNPMRITFSRGNVNERIFLSQQVSSDEHVVDMFACVGQFSLPIAFHSGANVLAIDINDLAYDFLCQNIRMNEVHENMTAVLGDCRDVTFRDADRIVMGYLHDTVDYLPHALNGLRFRGGIIHMHSLVHGNDERKIRNTIITESSEYGFMAKISSRPIKKYSPGVSHMVFDINLDSNR
ncbi:class I SAM-dependent methyltransferase family protein [Candidatus Thorarchaeota archaeon]|nr:MAG: class I SAM-dependent methyltransferase family protein [Candidatus Thorarchaeota archaeon]